MGRHAGLAKQRAFRFGVGIGVFDRDGQCFDLHQRVADDFDVGLATDQCQFKQMALQLLLVLLHPAFEVMDAGPALDELGVDHQLAVQRDVGLMPSTTVSDSAMRMRASAWSRVSPWTMILPIMES